MGCTGPGILGAGFRDCGLGFGGFSIILGVLVW